MAMPDWWIGWTGAAFIVSLVMNVAVIISVGVLVLKILPLISMLQREIKSVSGKVDSITTNVKDTVDNIHSKTTQILGTAEEASAEVTRKVSAASAAITAIFIVTRLVGAVRGMQQGAPKHDGKALTRPSKVKVVKR